MRPPISLNTYLKPRCKCSPAIHLNLENELNGASESGQQRLAVSFFFKI
jgi:hypothetical protein